MDTCDTLVAGTEFLEVVVTTKSWHPGTWHTQNGKNM